MEISRIWVAMLTRNMDNAGTNDPITLTINTDGVERLSKTFSDTGQKDQERSQANLYQVDVAGRNIVPEELTNSSIRVGIGGGDAWRPEHIMVWGERRSFSDTTIVPLAMETDITTQLSTQSSEGPPSMPLRLVERGNQNLQINRLFMLLTTGGGQSDSGIPASTVGNTKPGTASPLEIQIVSQDHLVVLSEIRNTTQEDLEAGGANFYSAPVIAPFRKRDLDNRSITLRIKGLDDWEPLSFFIFGLDDAAGRPERLVPLVHFPRWPHGNMKADSTTGVASVNLQLTPEPLVPIAVDQGQVAVALNSIASGQEKAIKLLQKLLAKQK